MRDPKYIQDANRHTLKQGRHTVEIFRTNVKSEYEADLVLTLLKQSLPQLKINFDLDDCDNILRVAGEAISTEYIITVLNDLGFECIELN